MGSRETTSAAQYGQISLLAVFSSDIGRTLTDTRMGIFRDSGL